MILRRGQALTKLMAVLSETFGKTDLLAVNPPHLRRESWLEKISTWNSSGGSMPFDPDTRIVMALAKPEFFRNCRSAPECNGAEIVEKC